MTLSQEDAEIVASAVTDAVTEIVIPRLGEAVAKVVSDVVAEGFAKVHSRLEKLEGDVAALKTETADVQDSLRTIRTTMADMRSSVDGLAADVRNLYRRLPVGAQAAE